MYVSRFANLYRSVHPEPYPTDATDAADAAGRGAAYLTDAVLAGELALPRIVSMEAKRERQSLSRSGRRRKGQAAPRRRRSPGWVRGCTCGVLLYGDSATR
jgi:hypothetical protein